MHCHILWGIDDGPERRGDAIDLARAVVAEGTGTVVATPHVNWDWPENDAERIRDRVAEINQALLEEDIPLIVLAGAEVALTRAIEMEDAQLRALTLGGGGWLLLEPPLTPGTAGFDAMFEQIRARGFDIVIAHPERCPAFSKDRARFERFIGQGMLSSVTAGAFSGKFGGPVQRVCAEWHDAGLIHNVASDFHGVTRRRPRLLRELRENGMSDLEIKRVAVDTPRAILDGTPIPVPPRREKGRTAFLGRLRRSHV